jgi:hypothetical protein
MGRSGTPDSQYLPRNKEAQREQFNSFDELAHGFGAAGEFKAQTSTEAALLCPGDFMTR